MTRAFVFLALLLVPAALACGSDGCEDDTACNETTRQATHATPTDTGDVAPGNGGVLLEMLAAIPDTPESAKYFSFTDFELLREQGGVDLPPDDSDPEAIDEWVVEAYEEASTANALPTFSQFVSSLGVENAALRRELGIDISQIDQAIDAGEPPAVYNLLRGRFDAGDVDDAVHSDDNFSDILETETHEGAGYYTWGEDFAQDFERITPVRRLGVGYRLALYEDLLFWCGWTDGVTGMIDAAAGDTPSLADRKDFRAIAVALNALNVPSVLMTTQTLSAPDAIPVLASFDSFAVAGGTDDEGAFMAIVIVNPDDATAEENVELIQQRFAAAADDTATYPWREGINSIEAHADGLLTIAILRGENLPLHFVDRGEDVILHE